MNCEAEPSSPERPPSAVVLLVDDQVMVAEAVRRLLATQSGIEYHACSDPAQALTTAERLRPTVILQDLVMPGTDGLALLTAYRQHSDLRDVPVIMLSSEDKPEIKGQAFEHGANDYLVKLPAAVELIARIHCHSRAYLDHQALQQVVRELESAQSQLLQSEKLASIGQLAAGVAHEINNPVGYINSNISSLKRYVENLFNLLASYEQAEGTLAPEIAQGIRERKAEMDFQYMKEDIMELVDESVEGVTRVKQIVQDLKDFSHVDEAEWQWSSLVSCVDSTLNIVNNEIKYKAEVVKEYAAVADIECIPSQLNQVFLNLLVNAAQAIEERGLITIRVEAPDPDWVQVAIRDTGKGMDEQTQKRIFDPFFTTKPVGQGTGLGLSLSYGIVQRHGGQIEVDSRVGAGTCFTVRLPVRQRSAEAR